jgi:16S rRNA (adenine1518-N6/adenine1519-N6)-dimethyltransferase
VVIRPHFQDFDPAVLSLPPFSGNRLPMSPDSAPRQTRSYLMKRFEEAGIHPRTKLGQNFLIDLNLLRLLHETARLEPCDVVLEVGTGTGALTRAMSEKAASVVTVELDAILYGLAMEELQDRPNVHQIQGDILQNKNRLNPEVLELVEQQRRAIPESRFKLVANLPYNIATPLLSNLLLIERPPVSMTVTIQKELADRIVARPGTKDYGALAIWMQSQCRCRIVRMVAPTVFWPRPKVQSAIIEIIPDERLRARIPDLHYFHRFVRSMFFHRRKFLRSELISAFKKELEKDDVDRILQQMGLDPQLRAETLDVPTMLRLCRLCREEVERKSGR